MSARPTPRPPVAFVSYDFQSVELRSLVLGLANDLRRDGVDARVDLYEPSPAEGWELWRERHLLAADFVVVVCTASYRRHFEAYDGASGGLQVRWEAGLVRRRLHDDPSFGARVLPVVLGEADRSAIPELLRGYTPYVLPEAYEGLLRRITGQPAITGPPLGTISHRIDNLGPRSLVFEGREDALAATRDELRRASKLMSCTVITGMGGIGKTRLALEHAHCAEDDYDLRWWVRASDRASVQADLVRLGTQLGILARPDRIEASVQEVLSWLSTHQRWLVVFDDAEGPAALRTLLPSPCRGHLLITSRSPAWRAIGQVVELQRLSPAAARTVLVQRAGRPDDGHADAVAEQLEHLPLALAAAGAYVEATRCSFREYLEALAQDGLSVLGDRKSVPDGSQQTLARTWELSLAEVRTRAPAAAALLDWLSFLDPRGVPLALLRERCSLMPAPLRACVSSRLALDDAIAVLIEFGMIERDHGMLRVHRLFQAVTRDKLAARDRQRLAAAVVRWLGAVFAYVPGKTLVRDVPAGVAEQIVAASAITACTRSNREPVAWLLIDVGDLHSTRGASHAAHAAYARAVELLEAGATGRSDGGQARRDLSIALTRLAGVERWAGNLAAAHHCFSRALELRKQLAYEDPRSPTARDDLASALGKLGDLALVEGKVAVAVDLFVQAVELREPLAEPPLGGPLAQRALARSSRKLGRSQARLGELDDATRTLRNTLALLETLVQSQPADVTVRRDLSLVLSDLGEVLELAGVYAEARDLHARALAIVEALAAADPGNARAQRDLSIGLNRWGLAEQRVGRLDEARRAIEHALVLRKALAAANPEDVQTQRDLARSRARLAALEQRESEATGLAHAHLRCWPVDATTPGCCELTLSDRAEPRKRARLLDPKARYWEALEEAEQLQQLGTMARAAGNLETARMSLRLLTEITNVLAKVDPRRRQALQRAARALYELGSVEHQLGALEPARTHFRRASELFDAHLGIDPTDAAARRDLARCLGELGQVELARGEPERAREPISRCRRLFESALVDAPGDVELLRELGEVLVQLGAVHARRGELEDARELLQRNLDLAYAATELAPHGIEARVGVFRALLRLAEVEIRLDNSPEVRELFRLLLEDHDVLVHANPEDAFAALDLVLLHAEGRGSAA